MLESDDSNNEVVDVDSYNLQILRDQVNFGIKPIINKVKENEFATAIDLNEINPLQDYDNMKVIKFVSDFLQSLDLELKYKRLFREQTISFDETLGYDKVVIDKFKKLVLEKDAYFTSNVNFLPIDSVYSAVSLRNARVTLCWRDIYLNDSDIKRILTLGIAYLSNFITKAEMLFHIRRITSQLGLFELGISERKSTYLVIRIRSPVFTY
jgi:hypothetical protein